MHHDIHNVNMSFIYDGQFQVGLYPVIYSEECAKAIVDAARRGKRYLTVATWFAVLYLWRVFVP